MNLISWAIKWGIPYAAIDDLQKQIGLLHDSVAPTIQEKNSSAESQVSDRIRLEAAQKGIYLWRNNVGAGKLENGVFIRWGLANNSERLNKTIKSADLIGVHRRLIVPTDVGTHIGQFVSREIKKEGWQYSGTPAEIAQLNWANLILTNGGNAAFATGKGTL